MTALHVCSQVTTIKRRTKQDMMDWNSGKERLVARACSSQSIILMEKGMHFTINFITHKAICEFWHTSESHVQQWIQWSPQDNQNSLGQASRKRKRQSNDETTPSGLFLRQHQWFNVLVPSRLTSLQSINHGSTPLGLSSVQQGLYSSLAWRLFPLTH